MPPLMSLLFCKGEFEMFEMKESVYKNYGEARVLGTSPSSGYELMHPPDFPVLRVGSRIVVPKGKFIEWVRRGTKGGDDR